MGLFLAYWQYFEDISKHKEAEIMYIMLNPFLVEISLDLQ